MTVGRWQFIWWGDHPHLNIRGSWPGDWRDKGWTSPVYDFMWYFGLFEVRRFSSWRREDV